MIIFHEGLPGSGKSFEAMVSHIVPAMKKGRKVFAYIEGLDHAKIAECADIPEARCRELLVQITREQVPTIHEHVENDSLVVIDELQNFFPAGRQKLTPEITQLVTEHRHRGLDLLCMGQVMNDCHALWKGRVDTKIAFRKLDAIGKANSYKWIVYKRVEGGKFQEATSGKRDYDEKYFGTYASHTQGTENTETYADARANIRNSKAFRYIRVYGLIAVAAIGFVVWFFASGGGLDKKKESPAAKPAEAAQQGAQQPGQQIQPVQPVRVTVSKVVGQFDIDAEDFIDQLSEKFRIRLGGVLHSQNRISGLIEWRDESGRLREKFTADQLRGLGWYVMISSDGAIASISKPGKSYLASQWPLEDDRAAAPERVPEKTQRQISPPERLAMAQ